MSRKRNVYSCRLESRRSEEPIAISAANPEAAAVRFVKQTIARDSGATVRVRVEIGAAIFTVNVSIVHTVKYKAEIIAGNGQPEKVAEQPAAQSSLNLKG